MHLVIGLVALVGFVISAAVHLLAVSGVDVLARYPDAWLLHIGVFIVFVPYVFASRETLGARPTLARIRAQFPGWVVAIGLCLFAYTIANFLVFLVHAAPNGNPEIQEGRYLLLNHGKVVRELAADEYASLRSQQIRGFSGHWMFLYFVPGAYFLLRKREASRS